MQERTSNAFWLNLLQRLASVDLRYREAHKLRSLPKERLDDMGLTRADADAAFLRHRYNRPADRDMLPITLRL